MKTCKTCNRESSVLSTSGECARCVEIQLNAFSDKLIDADIEVISLRTKIVVLEKKIEILFKAGGV
jgi:hypothetical protein